MDPYYKVQHKQTLEKWNSPMTKDRKNGIAPRLKYTKKTDTDLLRENYLHKVSLIHYDIKFIFVQKQIKVVPFD